MWKMDFLTTTLVLIATCVLGVAGVADLSSYRDVPVVALASGPDFAIGGFIFVPEYKIDEERRERFESDLSHEWGHLQQERGLAGGYTALVAIPSVFANLIARFRIGRVSPREGREIQLRYEGLWFERWADELGSIGES